MLLGALFCSMLSSISSITLSDKFWTEVGPEGQLINPRKVSLVSPRLDAPQKFMHNIEYSSFVASRETYNRNSFSQFGAAQRMENGTYCAWFPTSRESNEKACRNFRILSMPKRHRNLALFQWKPVNFNTEIDMKSRIRVGNHFAAANLVHQSVGFNGFHAGYMGYLQFGDFSEINREAVAVWTTPQRHHNFGLQANRRFHFRKNIIANATTSCGDGTAFKHNFPCLFLLHFDQAAIV